MTSKTKAPHELPDEAVDVVTGAGETRRVNEIEFVFHKIEATASSDPDQPVISGRLYNP